MANPTFEVPSILPNELVMSIPQENMYAIFISLSIIRFIVFDFVFFILREIFHFIFIKLLLVC
jgi:hypothetical protein